MQEEQRVIKDIGGSHRHYGVRRCNESRNFDFFRGVCHPNLIQFRLGGHTHYICQHAHGLQAILRGNGSTAVDANAGAVVDASQERVLGSGVDVFGACVRIGVRGRWTVFFDGTYARVQVAMPGACRRCCGQHTCVRGGAVGMWYLLVPALVTLTDVYLR